MSETRVSRTTRKSILSSLSALGASRSPVRMENVPRHKIPGTLAAAGASLAAVQSAEAGIVVENPNVNIGFAAGDVSSFKFNLASLKSKGLELKNYGSANYHSVLFKGTTPAFTNNNVHIRQAPDGAAQAAPAGKTFNQVATRSSFPGVNLAIRFATGNSVGPDFTDQYYAFSFRDSSNQTHYGWIYGSLSGGYGDLSYDLISYAYDTTAGVKIPTGFTGASVPEPSTLVMGAMASLVLGAAGVRKWKRDQAAKATGV